MNESRATRYQRLRRRARAAGLVSAEFVLAAIALTPLSRLLARWADGVAIGLSGVPHVTVSLTAFVACLVVCWELAALPAAYVAVELDGAYGRGEPTLEAVLGAQLRATAIAFPAALAAGGMVVTASMLAGAWWWALAAVFAAVGLAVALGGGPALFGRLADVRPLGKAALAARLTELATRARVSVAGIDEWAVGESDRASALVTGVGRLRRVLVASELVRHWTDDEVAVVVAHELAHHAYRDLWRTLALDAAILSAGLFAADAALRVVGPALHLAGPADLAALPFVVVAASVVWILATPLRHAQSRAQERRADVFALAVTGSADAFRTAVRRLGARHLAEERPTLLTRWLYYTHPSVTERLALAESYRRVTAERAVGTD